MQPAPFCRLWDIHSGTLSLITPWLVLCLVCCCRVQFGNETCTSLAVTCRGNLNPAPNSTDQSLGMRPDGELLVLGNNGVFAVLTGFDPSPAGLGLLAAYMTRFRAINPDTTCPAIPRYVSPLCACVRVVVGILIVGYKPHIHE